MRSHGLAGGWRGWRSVYGYDPPRIFRRRISNQRPSSHYTGVFLAFGGLLMILGSIGEWIVGNTFPFVVFGTFGESSLSIFTPSMAPLHPQRARNTHWSHRLLLACFLSNTDPLVQCLRRLCHRSHRRGRANGQSRQSGRHASPSFQLQLCFLPRLHG